MEGDEGLGEERIKDYCDTWKEDKRIYGWVVTSSICMYLQLNAHTEAGLSIAVTVEHT